MREALGYERWERFSPVPALLGESDWTDERLLRALDELYVALRDDDRAKGRSSRESAVFEFHDCGLAAIREALQRRRDDTDAASRPT